MAYAASGASVSAVAFYADWLHEVRPVVSGHRIILTYNLFLRGYTTGPVSRVRESSGAREVEGCVEEYFTTRVFGRHGLPDSDPPTRLAHSHSARGLKWFRLKGADAARASLLQAAAAASGCEIVLALAEIKETRDAHEPDAAYGHRGDDDETSTSTSSATSTRMIPMPTTSGT